MRKVGATMVVPATDIVPAVCRAMASTKAWRDVAYTPSPNVGGDPYGRYIYMRVARGNEQFVVTVDGCTGQVMR